MICSSGLISNFCSAPVIHQLLSLIDHLVTSDISHHIRKGRILSVSVSSSENDPSRYPCIHGKNNILQLFAAVHLSLDRQILNILLGREGVKFGI